MTETLSFLTLLWSVFHFLSFRQYTDLNECSATSVWHVPMCC